MGKKTLRRISFYALAAGTAILVLVTTLQPGSPLFYTSTFAFLVIVCLLGLSIWSVLFMEVEPTLTRIALVIIIALLTFLFMWLGSNSSPAH